MADAKVRDVSNKYDIQLLTTKSSKEFRVKWTVSDFSKLPSNIKFESPHLVPAFECRLFFQKRQNQEFIISLGNDSYRVISAVASVSIFDSDGKLLDSRNGSYKCIARGSIDIFKYSGVYQQLLSLKDDMLMLICKLKISKMLTTSYQSLEFSVKNPYGRTKLYEDLKTLFHDKRHADVTLKVDGAQIPANKAILSARSAVFEKRFRRNMDKQDNDSVQIDNMTLPVLKKLVEFLYTGELDVVTDIPAVSALYSAADKFEVLDLRKMCADTLISLISVDNVTEIVVTAYRHEDEYLKTKVLDFLGKNINCIMESEKWNEFIDTGSEFAAQVLEYCVKEIGIKS